MGTPQQSSKVQPSNLFSNPTDTTLKNSTCLRDPDSPSPRSSPLSSLTLSARRRLPGLSASSSCGLTSRRTTFRTLRTSSSSTPTRRWPRSSATTGFVLSVWPSSCALTSPRHWTFFPNNFHFHPFTKFIYNSSNSTPISKKGQERTYGNISGTTDFTPNLLWMPTLLLITTQRGLKQIEPSFKS